MLARHEFDHRIGAICLCRGHSCPVNAVFGGRADLYGLTVFQWSFIPTFYLFLLFLYVDGVINMDHCFQFKVTLIYHLLHFTYLLPLLCTVHTTQDFVMMGSIVPDMMAYFFMTKQVLYQILSVRKLNDQVDFWCLK